MASNESFKQAIKAYLDKRAEEDSLFAPKYANEKKNIDECCSYIMGEARKRGNAVAISDEEVYGMAVHYYDEELCIKTGQTDMLKHMYKTGYYQLRYKPSFNICNRNRYIIRDASMWNDYISLLSYFHKDLHNAKYVCPKNLKAEHDRLLRKKNEIEARQRRKRDRIKAIQKEKQLKEDIASFYNRMERFFGMEIKGNGITIRPLESVTQFYKEGKAMHHCVYANRYYRRSECLIMTAIVGEKHAETIEVNLKSFQIVQSRAVCNGTSEYHDCIIRLVEKNMSLIKKRIA